MCSNRVCLLVWKETNTTVSCVLYKYVWPSTKLHNKIYHLLIILGTNISCLSLLLMSNGRLVIYVVWSLHANARRETSYEKHEGGRGLEMCLRFTSFKRVSDRFQDTVKTQHCHVSNCKEYSSIHIQAYKRRRRRRCWSSMNECSTKNGKITDSYP